MILLITVSFQVFIFSLIGLALLVGFLYALYFFLLGLTGGELERKSMDKK